MTGGGDKNRSLEARDLRTLALKNPSQFEEYDSKLGGFVAFLEKLNFI